MTPQDKELLKIFKPFLFIMLSKWTLIFTLNAIGKHLRK